MTIGLMPTCLSRTISLAKLEEIGRDEVINNKIYIKFGCYPEAVVQQKGEPASYQIP